MDRIPNSARFCQTQPLIGTQKHGIGTETQKAIYEEARNAGREWESGKRERKPLPFTLSPFLRSWFPTFLVS
jgi:hypothetical protein